MNCGFVIVFIPLNFPLNPVNIKSVLTGLNLWKKVRQTNCNFRVLLGEQSFLEDRIARLP